uniref:Uncharacterized protein n=1 Tax=Anguilla anguilla TaxID=7936 RepID=A0A0E9QD60_ANGAN
MHFPYLYHLYRITSVSHMKKMISGQQMYSFVESYAHGLQ